MSSHPPPEAGDVGGPAASAERVRGFIVESQRDALVEELRERVDQLQGALDSRVVIEQAKGILAERFQLGVDEAFLLLRRAARTHRLQLRALAEQVVASHQTPVEIDAVHASGHPASSR